jgi:hypothetical protein
MREYDNYAKNTEFSSGALASASRAKFGRERLVGEIEFFEKRKFLKNGIF